MNRQTEIQSPFSEIGKVVDASSQRVAVKLPGDRTLYELLSISGKTIHSILKSAESWVLPQNLFLKVLEGIFKRESIIEGEAAVVSVCIRSWVEGSDLEDEGGIDVILSVELRLVSWLSVSSDVLSNEPGGANPGISHRLSVEEMLRRKKENQQRRLSTSDVDANFVERETSEMRACSEVTNVEGDCDESDPAALSCRLEQYNEKEEYIALRGRIDGVAALFRGLADLAESLGLSTDDLVECYTRAGGSGKVPSMSDVSKDEVSHKFLQSREGGCSHQ